MFILCGGVGIYIGMDGKKKGKANKGLVVTLAIVGTIMLIMSIAVGLLAALAAGVCAAVDEVVDAHNEETGGDAEGCPNMALMYIASILDMIAGLIICVFGYGLCCCTKDASATATVNTTVVVQQAAP